MFLKANLKSGIDTVLDLVHFDSLLEGGPVITGEGKNGLAVCFWKGA